MSCSRIRYVHSENPYKYIPNYELYRIYDETPMVAPYVIYHQCKSKVDPEMVKETIKQILPTIIDNLDLDYNELVNKPTVDDEDLMGEVENMVTKSIDIDKLTRLLEGEHLDE